LLLDAPHGLYVQLLRVVTMKQFFRASLVLFVVGALAPLGAQDMTADDMRSLDGQVQEIKSDVLSIASDLDVLEERLLYPSNTQLAVFVSIADDEDFRLDAVQVAVDGEPATHYIYSFKELDALRNGGIQRIYTGNVPTGDHQLSITMTGKLKSGKDFSETDSFSFAKGVEPKALGIMLAGPGLGNDGIEIGAW
jgi:hypothetical protein